MSSGDDKRAPAPRWSIAADRVLRVAVAWLSCTLLVLMVFFTVYTVVMRYVFKNPPFWGDTVALFCNIWLVLVAYCLAVRDREDIVSEGLYIYLPSLAQQVFRYAWQVLTLFLGIYLVWFGTEAALNVPGEYWELRGLPRKYPMLALPLCGVLVTLMTAMNLAEEALGWRRPAPPPSAPHDGGGSPLDAGIGRPL